jgi:hypothetical protein
MISTYSECVFVTLVTQHARRMRLIILSCVACRVVSYFSTFIHKRHDFRKTLLNIQSVFWFSIQSLSETFLILEKIQGDIINVRRSLRKVHVILFRF